MTVASGDELHLDDRISRLLESDPSAVADPFPLYRDLLDRAPVYEWGPTLVVSRFDDVKAILRDNVAFSNTAYRVGSRADAIRSRLSPSEAQAFDEISEFEGLYVSRVDGSEHQRLREIAHRAFTPRKMAELQLRAQQFTDDLLTSMLENSQTDFVDGVASRLPTMMINSLLDIPLEDVELIKQWTARIGKNRGGQVTADMVDAHQALREFRSYIAEILDHQRREPAATELVSTLMAATTEGRLRDEELLATTVVLAFTGSDTTTALLANGMHAVLGHQDQWERIRQQPALVPAAVEELLRYLSPVQTLWRVVAQPTVVGGVPVPVGRTILLLLGAANRDAARFSNPDDFDVERPTNQHISLGFGVHYCIGAALARLEAATVFRTLAERFPEIALKDPSATYDWRGNIQFRTIAKLDVALNG